MTIWRGYALIFSSAVETRDSMQRFLEDQPECGYWYSAFWECIFFTSTLTPLQLRERIDARFGVRDQFFFTILEVNRDADGRLPLEAWAIFMDPEMANDERERALLIQAST